jgi:hypothetical protein
MGKRKVQPVDSDDEVALEPSDVEVEVGVDTPELIPCNQLIGAQHGSFAVRYSFVTAEVVQ